MFRKILIVSGYLFLIAFLAVTLAFSSLEGRNVSCREIQVQLAQDDIIRLSKNEISRLVLGADNQVVGKELRHINTDFIEQEIEKHQAILKAEVYKVITEDTTSSKGILGVRVKHRKPVVRIMSAGGRYYLDDTGARIPVSPRYTANVLVATGSFSEEFARQELLPFVLYLNESPFWQAQIEQVHVDSGGGIVLSPLVGDQVIELGSLHDYPVKLKNLKAFYEQVLARDNW